MLQSCVDVFKIAFFAYAVNDSVTCLVSLLCVDLVLEGREVAQWHSDSVTWPRCPHLSLLLY